MEKQNESKFAGADPSYFEYLQNRVNGLDHETLEQRKQAEEVFLRVMSEGAKKYGFEWLEWHSIARDLVDADYLPKGQWGATDVRFEALSAEIAFAILSKYRLVPREPSPEALDHAAAT